jgi:hypothetical protein
MTCNGRRGSRTAARISAAVKAAGRDPGSHLSAGVPIVSTALPGRDESTDTSTGSDVREKHRAQQDHTTLTQPPERDTPFNKEKFAPTSFEVLYGA